MTEPLRKCPRPDCDNTLSPGSLDCVCGFRWNEMVLKEAAGQPDKPQVALADSPIPDKEHPIFKRSIADGIYRMTLEDLDAHLQRRDARITELEARAEKVLALAEAALKNVNEAFFMPAETALDRIRDIHYGKDTP